MDSKIPKSLVQKVKKFEKMTKFDVMEKLEKICKSLHTSDEHTPSAYDFVCPICESYMFYVIVQIPGKNKTNVVECQQCKSQSSKRIVECNKIELLFFLKHET